jgi:hypothetical protein
MGIIAYLKPYELQSLKDLKQSLSLDFQLTTLRLYGSSSVIWNWRKWRR